MDTAGGIEESRPSTPQVRVPRAAATPEFETVEVGGVPMAVSTLDAATAWLANAVDARVGVSVRLLNAYCIALASDDPQYRDLVATSGVNFPDGKPVVWVMRRRVGRDPGSVRPAQVRGPSLFRRSLGDLERRGSRCFFLGSTDSTLERLQAELNNQYPGLRIAAVYSPPFEDVTEEFLADCESRIIAAQPDIVWLGLGTPKQDVVSSLLASRVSVPIVGVGAAFDFVAGTVREAPGWLHGSGLEWTHRLFTEPRRLWRRYLVGNAKFLLATSRREHGGGIGGASS